MICRGARGCQDSSSPNTPAGDVDQSLGCLGADGPALVSPALSRAGLWVAAALSLGFLWCSSGASGQLAGLSKAAEAARGLGAAAQAARAMGRIKDAARQMQGAKTLSTSKQLSRGRRLAPAKGPATPGLWPAASLTNAQPARLPPLRRSVVPADPYATPRRRTQFADAVAEDDVALAAKLLAADRGLLSINPSTYLGRDYPAPPGASQVNPARLRFSSPLAPSEQVAGQRPLHLAAERASASMVDLLIRKGHPVNAATRQGYTPLHFAAVREAPGVLKVLLGRGARVDAASVRGFTPLQCAIIAFQPGSAKLLLAAGAGPNAGSKSGCPALLCALRQGDCELAGLLLSRGADPRATYKGFSALHMAVAKGTTDMARRLLRAGCRPDARDARGRTPLHLLLSGPRPWDSLPDLPRPDLRTQDPLALSMTNDSPFADRRLSGDGLGLVEALLEGGADPNAADASGTTPLLALARGLLEKGTSGAEELDAWSAKCAKLLVSHGARGGTRDRSGASALAIAEKRGAEALAAALR